MRHGRTPLALCLLAFFVPLCIHAQNESVGDTASVRGESATVRKRIEQARQKAADGRWPEAVEEFQRVLDSAGDTLVAADPRRLVPARWLCQYHLSKLPPAALKVYRTRVEGQARKWLDEGRRTRNVRLLERVVSEAFCTRSAEEAINLLADLAFERGEFARAEQYWRLLDRPDPQAKEPDPEAPLELHYPDPQTDPAATHAKEILSEAFQGRLDAARRELAAFREAHPKATGTLAGRKGPFADTLQELLDRPEALDLPSGPGAESPWTTFAANPARDSVLRGGLPYYWPDHPAWQSPIPPEPLPKGKSNGPPLLTARALAFHPVIANGYALVCDARRVFAFDLSGGQVAKVYDLRNDAEVPTLDLRLPVRADLRYTLTTAGGNVYARLGVQALRPPPQPLGPEPNKRELKESDSYIVCLGPLRAGKEGADAPLRWTLRPNWADNEGPAIFEGAPLVRDDRLYVAVWRLVGDRAVTSVACYEGAEGRDRPELAWQTDLLDVPFNPSAEPRSRHELLTLAGPNVVFCSHTGAVVALDAVSGKRAWAYRYPRAARRPPESLAVRDLTPCVYADGRVFAAPADADRVFCFDATSGRLLWESGSMEVAHLLGVSRGRLVCTTGGPVKGIRGLSVATGSDRAPDGWVQHADGGLAPYGRGFLGENVVFWPTRHGLFFLRPDDGSPLRPPIPGELGNLCFGDGCLIVTTPTEVWGFVSERRLLPQRKQDAEQHRDDAAAQYRLGLAEADAGHDPAALAAFGRTERLADGLPLGQFARQRRYELIADRAEQALRLGRGDESRALLRSLADGDFAPAWRARALARLALLESDANRPAAALAVWQSILDREELRGAWLSGPDGLPVRAGDLAAARVAALLQKDGRAAYAEIEKQARAAWANTPEAWEKLALTYPNAEATRSALRRLARRPVPAEDPEQAASLFRTLLRVARTAPAEGEGKADAALALIGLARGYEKAKHFPEALAVWQRLEREQGGETLETLSPKLTVAEWVAEHRKKLEEQLPRPAETALTAPSIPVPLLRAGRTLLKPFAEWPLLPLTEGGDWDGASAPEDSSRLFLGSEGRLVCLDAAGGRPLWERALGFTPRFAAFFGGSLIAAGPDGAARVRLADGRVLWEFHVPDLGPLPRSAGRVALRSLAAPIRSEPLASFRIGGGRLFCVQGGNRLLALDLETGCVEWLRDSGSAPAFHPHYYAGERFLLVQLSSGRRWVLDAASGRVEREAATTTVPWGGDPVPLDGGRVAVADGAGEVVALDLATGQPAWTHEIGREESLTGEPPQFRLHALGLLVRISRNQGYELDRLDPDTGKRRWSDAPLFLGRTPVALHAAGADASNLYFVGESGLTAHALSTGKQLWAAPLPVAAERWRVRAGRNYLLAVPREAVGHEETSEAWGRFRRAVGTWPSFARFQRGLFSVYDAWMARTFNVLLLDSADGRLVQKLNFPARGPRALATPAKGGLTVAVEGEAWGLRGPGGGR